MEWFEQTPFFQYARVGRQYAEAAGYPVDYNGSAYSFDYTKREAAGEVPRSALDFEQQYGNNYGRFGSVDQTYIAAALQTGKVTLRPLTEVTGIRRERSGEYVVSTREIDRWGKEVARELDGRDDPENPVYASIFSIPLPVETLALGYYVMVKTDDRAEITYDRGADKILIGWPEQYNDHISARAKAVFDKVTQANGVDYRDDIFNGTVFAPNTVHPLGGCGRSKATDSYGRVDGYEKLRLTLLCRRLRPELRSGAPA